MSDHEVIGDALVQTPGKPTRVVTYQTTSPYSYISLARKIGLEELALETLNERLHGLECAPVFPVSPFSQAIYCASFQRDDISDILTQDMHRVGAKLAPSLTISFAKELLGQIVNGYMQTLVEKDPPDTHEDIAEPDVYLVQAYILKMVYAAGRDELLLRALQLDLLNLYRKAPFFKQVCELARAVERNPLNHPVLEACVGKVIALHQQKYEMAAQWRDKLKQLTGALDTRA